MIEGMSVTRAVCVIFSTWYNYKSRRFCIVKLTNARVFILFKNLLCQKKLNLIIELFSLNNQVAQHVKQ